MYRRAFSTLGCAEFTIEEAAALARRHGITQLELRALGGTLELPTYFAAHYGSPAALAAKLTAICAQIAAFDTGFRLIAATDEDRAKLLEFLPWAEACGVPWLRIFDGGESLEASALAGAADHLQWWRSVRRERGSLTDLMIETHDILLDADRIEHFNAAMPPGTVQLLWDAHHTWKKGGEEVATTWAAIKTHVVHVHVKDSVTRPSGDFPYTYVLPGTGEFPMAALRSALAAEFSGVLSLEWEKRWHPYLPPLDDALISATDLRWW